MAKIQKRDYFFGAALSLFLSKNRDSRPSLIECSETSCQYKMITDTSGDFYLYMKYASKGTSSQNERVWQFALTSTDKQRIDDCISSGLKTYIILICGNPDFSDGEIAVLTQNEYKDISHKTGIRVKLQGKSPKKFIIADKTNKSFPIDRNRFDRRMTDL